MNLLVNPDNATLLVLTPDFPDKYDQYIGSIFVKEQVENICIYFKKIIVISPVLYSFKLLSSDKLCNNYSYYNIDVYYPRCFFIPNAISFFPGKEYFDIRYNVIQKCIESNMLNFDLIHSHFTYPSSYCAFLLKQKYNVPYVMTVNEDSAWLVNEMSLNSDRFVDTWKNANKIISINQWDNQKLTSFNSNNITIPYSYNERYFYRDMVICRDILNIPTDVKMLFSCGIFQKRKGFEYLIHAMDLICDERDDIHCYIGGKSEIETFYERQIKNLVIDLNLEDNVHFTGFLEFGDIPLWMNACDLYVSPSLSEGLGITQIEALACGKPVIATCTNGSRSIISSKDIGLLCKVADPVDLAAKIIDGLETKWDTNKILRSRNVYSGYTISRKLLDVYNEVLQ